MKCETPALASGSSREPAPIQRPIAAERTPSMRSVMTRSPPGRVVNWCDSILCTQLWLRVRAPGSPEDPAADMSEMRGSSHPPNLRVT